MIGCRSDCIVVYDPAASLWPIDFDERCVVDRKVIEKCLIRDNKQTWESELLREGRRALNVV